MRAFYISASSQIAQFHYCKNIMKSSPRILFLLLLCLALLVQACGPGNEKVITGTAIEINYSGQAQISGDMWIEIDGKRFSHYELHDDLITKPDALPATRVYHLEAPPESEEERQIFEPFTRLDIAIRLSHYLSAVRSNNSSVYRIANPELLMLRGVLRISRTDENEIKVRVPADYPASISVIEG